MSKFLFHLRNSLLLISPVLALAAFHRYLLKSWIPLAVNWGEWGTDFYFILPLSIASYYFSFYSNLRVSFRSSTWLPAVLVNLAFTFFNFHLSRNAIPVEGGIRILWFALAGLAFLFALRLFVSLREVFASRHWLLGGFCLLIGGSIAMAAHLPDAIWQTYSAWFGNHLCNLFQAFDGGTHCRFNPSHFDTRIAVGSTVLAIHRGCLGFDGLLLFLWAFLLFTLTQTNRRTILLSTAALFLGLIGIWWLNLFRVVLLVALATWMSRWFGGELRVKLVVDFFHLHAGWVFYSVYLAVFFAAFRRVIHSNDARVNERESIFAKLRESSLG